MERKATRDLSKPASDLKGPLQSTVPEKRLCHDGKAVGNGTATSHKLFKSEPRGLQTIGAVSKDSGNGIYTYPKCNKVTTGPQFSIFGIGPVAKMPCKEGYKRVGEDCVKANIDFE